MNQNNKLDASSIYRIIQANTEFIERGKIEIRVINGEPVHFDFYGLKSSSSLTNHKRYIGISHQEFNQILAIFSEISLDCYIEWHVVSNSLLHMVLKKVKLSEYSLRKILQVMSQKTIE